MAITAAQVKELRERTGAGMMECKKALVETDGDMETAIEHMRKTGLAKADKKAGRTAAEGIIVVKTSGDGKRMAMVEVNCETDFVAKGDDFRNFAEGVAQRVLEKQPEDIDALSAMSYSDDDATTIADVAKGMIVKIGENISIRRLANFETSTGTLSYYKHGDGIGVAVETEGGDDSLGRDLAMHIAASRPECVSEADVSVELVQKEKDIFSAQAAESGKPAEIIEKMVEGRIKKFLKEITLLGQPFVKDPDNTIEQLLKSANATVIRFQRFEVGEGIEKKEDDFVSEVMAQVRGS